MPENLDLVANNGVSVWLDCPLPMIERRAAVPSHHSESRASWENIDFGMT